MAIPVGMALGGLTGALAGKKMGLGTGRGALLGAGLGGMGGWALPTLIGSGALSAPLAGGAMLGGTPEAVAAGNPSLATIGTATGLGGTALPAGGAGLSIPTTNMSSAANSNSWINPALMAASIGTQGMSFLQPQQPQQSPIAPAARVGSKPAFTLPNIYPNSAPFQSKLAYLGG